MKRDWWKLALAAALGAAIAVPAVVIARGGADASGDADRLFADTATDIESEGSGWSNVMTMPETAGDIAVTLSAQVTKGKPKFRLTSSAGSVNPPSVTFGDDWNTATFGSASSCPPQTLQIKRKGDVKAVANVVSVVVVYDLVACA